MNIRLTVMALALSLVATSTSAQMRGACLPHEIAVGQLEKGYGERQVGLGIGQGGGAVYELYVADTGNWTILVTRPNGVSCIAASGTDWMDSPLLVGGRV